jgi:hypothetical protein
MVLHQILVYATRKSLDPAADLPVRVTYKAFTGMLRSANTKGLRDKFGQINADYGQFESAIIVCAPVGMEEAAAAMCRDTFPELIEKQMT